MAHLTMVSGSGLISGVAGTENHFNVYTGRSGIGDLSVRIDGPSRAEVKFIDNHDGSVRVTYVPTLTGEYKVHIYLDGLTVPRSPFMVPVRAHGSRHYELPLPSDAPSFSRSTRAVRVSGRGVVNGLTMIPNEIVVDVSKSVPGRLTWTIEGPGTVESWQRTNSNRDGIYKLFYQPHQPGLYVIHIKYAERDVKGSPFLVQVA
ncbi:filamin-A-like isoform X2 [Brevipalpus obovatus]|uniref:filamin-A-like isoform X2 n=1 Tax=Brevipalpus obovatus TaxID=246614 RepID=UPI003D9E4446